MIAAPDEPDRPDETPAGSSAGEDDVGDGHLIRQLRDVNEQLVMSNLRAQALATEANEARRALEATESALREANRRKDVFLAMLGHELRNPLAPILGALHLMK